MVTVCVGEYTTANLFNSAGPHESQCGLGSHFPASHLPKVLILQSASARAGADRTFSDQYLGQVRGGQQMKKRERSQGLLRLVFLSCWLRVGPREDGTLCMGTLMM